jgi:DNA-binding transcriptional LysR family regulator
LIERVRAGAADLALIGASGTTPPDLDALPIVSERLVAAVPPDHALAKRRRIALVDTCGFPIVCMPEGTGVRTVFDQACAARGINPDIALQASAPGAVADLAIRGLGIAILSESMVTKHIGRLKALLIADIETPAVLALVVLRTERRASRPRSPLSQGLRPSARPVTTQGLT